jgi:hypothetical protein
MVGSGFWGLKIVGETAQLWEGGMRHPCYFGKYEPRLKCRQALTKKHIKIVSKVTLIY